MVPTEKLVSTMEEPSRGSKATEKPDPPMSTGSGTSSEHAHLHTCCGVVVERRGDGQGLRLAGLGVEAVRCGFARTKWQPGANSPAQKRSAPAAATTNQTTHRVAQGLEQQVVGEDVDGQLLITKAVHAGGAGARGGADLFEWVSIRGRRGCLEDEAGARSMQAGAQEACRAVHARMHAKRGCVQLALLLHAVRSEWVVLPARSPCG